MSDILKTWRVGKMSVLDKKNFCVYCGEMAGACEHAECKDPWLRLAGRNILGDDGIVHRIFRAFVANDAWDGPMDDAPGNIEDCDEVHFSQFTAIAEVPLTDKPVTCFACLSREPG